MLVGRVASLRLLLPPAPAATAAATTTTTTTSLSPAISVPAIFSTPLSFLQGRSANKRITVRARACSKPATSSSSPSSSIHSTGTSSIDGGGLNPVSHFLSRARRRGGYSVAFASSGRRRGKSASPEFVEMDDGDEDYDKWEEGEGEEDSPPIPFDEMRRWLRNKPAGFGEGKSYDTSIEDRLMEEIEQIRKAQLENVNKLKNGVTGEGSPKKQQTPTPDAEVVEVAPNIARVRIRGLPRKKNIDRDLKSAFKGFPSIVNISPAVLGNKKTRDPVCKGFAFIDFVSNEAADKFVQKYSKQNVLFGRVQKEIICEVVARFHSYNSDSEKVGQQQLTDFQLEISTGQNLDISTHILEVQDSEENYKRITTEEQPSSLMAGTTIGVGYLDGSSLINEESSSLRSGEKAAESGAAKQNRKGRGVSKKNLKKTKPDKAPKYPTLNKKNGSAARLKVKERAVLTGVLFKYGDGAVPNIFRAELTK